MSEKQNLLVKWLMAISVTLVAAAIIGLIGMFNASGQAAIERKNNADDIKALRQYHKDDVQTIRTYMQDIRASQIRSEQDIKELLKK